MAALSRDVRMEVDGRDNSACVRCGAGRSMFGLNVHHRTPRGMGGSKDPLLSLPCNLITLCGSGTTGCHGWVESHRDAAARFGYLVPRGVDPATVPVMYADGYWWLLGVDGSRRPQL